MEEKQQKDLANKNIKDKDSFILEIIVMTIVVSILLYGVFLLISLVFRDKNQESMLNLGDTLSYFGAILTAIVTIFGVMYQIQENNKKIGYEKENKVSNLKAYINFIIQKNTEIYFSDENNNREKFYNNILEIISNKDFNMLELVSGIIYPFDKEYISKNLEEILNLENGKKILELHEELCGLEWSINKSLMENIDEQKFVEKREVFEGEEEIQEIFSILSLIDNMFFNNFYSKFSFERLKKIYFNEITDEEWKDIIKFENKTQKYEAYSNFIGLTLRKMEIPTEKKIMKLSLNLKKRYLILNHLKRKEEKISKLILEIGILS